MEPPSSPDARIRAAWQADRSYLLAVAAGMLGRPADAEDVVQEAFGPDATGRNRHACKEKVCGSIP
jgi:Sigma-70 region 2